MSKKSKINQIEKIKIVERYLSGEIGMHQAGKELRIAYQSLQKWVSIYKGKNPSGLLDQSQNNHYSKELKKSMKDYLLFLDQLLLLIVRCLIVRILLK